MSKPIINFIFGIGHRCYATNFLVNYKLRKMSSPFDYLIIDFESCLKIINTNFENFLSDIVFFEKKTKKIELYYKKNTNDINKMFYELVKNNIKYMASDYNDVKLLLNQNYIDENIMNSNLYFWKGICSFNHHNILDKDIYDTIKKRYERFIKILNTYTETTALFHITQIINVNSVLKYIERLIELKKSYDIKCFLIVIICCDTINRNFFYNKLEDKCLFIIKNVENYKTQCLKYNLENALEYYNYDNDFKILSDHFTFDLIEKTNVDNYTNI